MSREPSSCTSRRPTWTRIPAPKLLVNSIDISDDASRIVAGTFFRAYGADAVFGTYCYDDKGNLLWSRLLDASEGVYWVAISGNGCYAAAGGLAAPNQGFVELYDVSAGAAMTPRLSAPGRVNRVDLSRDGGVLVACAGSQIFIARRAGAGYGTPQTFTLDSNAVSVAVSSDGRWIAAISYQATVYLYANDGGVAKPAATATYPLTDVAGHSIQFSPSGDWFAAACGGADHGGSFALFQTATFAERRKPYWDAPVQPGGSVYSVALAERTGTTAPVVAATVNKSPGGQVVLVGTNGSLPDTLWTFATVKPPNCVAMNQAGSLVAIADGYPENTPGNFYLLDGATGKCEWTCPSGNMNWPIAIALDTNAIAAGSDDSQVYFFAP